MSNLFVFLKHFLIAPRKIGSAFPSSQNLAKALLLPFVLRDQDSPCKILEIGAGTGVITDEIIKHLLPKDQLDILEIDEEFVDLLEQRFQKNFQIQLFKQSILDFAPPKKYQFIISSLPLNAFSAAQVKTIFEKLLSLSVPGTIISYFEYRGIGALQTLFSTQKEKDNLEGILKIKNQFYERYPFAKSSVWSNLPPAKIFHQKIT